MPPKPGNAFAQQKELQRLEQMQRNLEGHFQAVGETNVDHTRYGLQTEEPTSAVKNESEDIIKKTTLDVPSYHAEQPSTAATTMAAVLGPETEQDKRGREMVKEQRDFMEAKLHRKRSHKSRRSTDTSRTTIKHSSSEPAPLFRRKFGKIKSVFKKPLRSNELSATAALNKPLPTISAAEAAYAREVGVYIPGAYVVSPPPTQARTITQGNAADNQHDYLGPEGAHTLPFAQVHMQANREPVQSRSAAKYNLANSQFRPMEMAMQASPIYNRCGSSPFDSNCPVLNSTQSGQSQLTSHDQDWPLPSPRNTTGHFSARTTGIDPGQYRRTGNQGMVFSNYLLNPTRAGDFATYGQPKLVQNHPSIMSMSASVVDPMSPATAQPAASLPALVVVPEVQETRAMQAANASTSEHLYNQGAEGSYSAPISAPAPPAAAAAGSVANSTPRIPRSRSVPIMHIASVPAAVPARRRASTGTNVVVESSSAVPPAVSKVPPPVSFATDALIDELYLQLREDLEMVASRVKSSRRAVQSDLVIIHEQIKAVQERQGRIEAKLDALMGALARGRV